MLPGVKTMEIYKGALPYIIIQFIVIMIVIAFPGLVTHYKDDASVYDPDMKIDIPSFGGSALDGGMPGMSLPSLGDNGGNGLPGLTLPGLGLPGAAPDQPAPAQPAPAPGMDLGQPPKFN